MSPDDLTPNPSAANVEGSGSSRRTVSPATRPAEVPQALKCPRCDSPNTKFCYYNNYSLTQPRHFCKTCRRYWTKGGALRNVPIGGGCRKNKKMSSKSSSSRLSSGDSKDSAGSSSYSDIGGFKFFNNLSPAMDFQLGGLNGQFPRFQSPGCHVNNNIYSQLPTSYGDISAPLPSFNSGFALDPSSQLMGFNFPLSSPSVPKQDHGISSGFSGGSVVQDIGGTITNTNTNTNNLVSSFESLSSIHQNLHWKLQQQRIATLFQGGGDVNDNDNVEKDLQTTTVQKPQPILFENLEISPKTGEFGGENIGKDINGSTSGMGNLATEWYFDKYTNYAPAAVNPTPTNSSNTTGDGIQGGWSNFDPYTALP